MDLNKYIEKIMNKRAEILDDFARAYIAGRKLSIGQVKRLELVCVTEEHSVTYRFRIRPGKSKLQIKQK